MTCTSHLPSDSSKSSNSSFHLHTLEVHDSSKIYRPIPGHFEVLTRDTEMAKGQNAGPEGLRARVDGDANRDKVSSNNAAGRLESPEENGGGITSLLGRGREIEIHELDKSGNITQRWLHKPNNQIVPVSGQQLTPMNPTDMSTDSRSGKIIQRLLSIHERMA